MGFLSLLANRVIGVSATRVGILFTVSSFAGVLMSIPMGMIADRIGRKNSMMLGMTLSALSMAGIAFSPTYAWLMFFAILSGLGAAAFTPAALGMVSDSVPSNWQGTAMGIYGAFGENIGIIAGSSFSGFIWSAWGSSYTFLVSSGVIALGICGLHRFVKNEDQRKFSTPLKGNSKCRDCMRQILCDLQREFILVKTKEIIMNNKALPRRWLSSS